MKKIRDFKVRFKNYGKIKQIKRESLDTKLYEKVQALNYLKIFLGSLIALFICFFIFITIKKYVFPQNDDTTYTAVPNNQDSDYQDKTQDVTNDFVFVVNNDNMLSKDYKVKLSEIYNIFVDEKIKQALSDMYVVAKEDGVTLDFDYGYVSPEEQNELYTKKIDELVKTQSYTIIMATAKASFYFEDAYYSDKQTGLCVTLKGDKENFVKTKTYDWLVNKAADFGFVFRYPSNKESVTLHEQDPTVLRYVGTENANLMRQLGMCLEEYYDYKKAKENN